MALVPPRRIYPISEIDLGTGLWTAEVQVVESYRNQESSGRRAGNTKIYKRLLLVDEHGTKVSAVLYENDIQYHSASLKPFKRYRISNARLTPAFAFFRVGPYAFTWVITNETPVELIDEPNVPLIPFSYDICPYNEFLRHADRDIGINIKGIAVQAFPIKQVNAHSTIREIVIIDESKQPVILALWNTFADTEGTMIADNIANTPVIIAVNVRATTFHGLSLSTRTYSCILVDPPLEDSVSLKEWYAKNKSGITQLLRVEAYKQLDMLLPPPALDETIDVPTAVATINTIHTAWVHGELRLTPSNQAYHLTACKNCHKKVVAAAGWSLTCSSCGQYAQVELRCRVPLEITGGNKSLPIIMTTPDVEQLGGVTAEQLRDSHEFGSLLHDINVHEDLHAALDKLPVVCFVRKYDTNTLGCHNGPGIRYSVVKAYNAIAMREPVVAAPALPAPAEESMLPNDDQLFTPGMKKSISEIEGTSALEKGEQSTPPSKRSMHFMSSPSSPPPAKDATLSGHESTLLPAHPIEAPIVDKSPIKRGKEMQGSQ